MSKINQIQNALNEIDGGLFQKVGDSYLLKKGYNQINSIGSVIGKNKVKKGTPDTLIPKGNGLYIFAEHTTIEKSKVLNKFSDDIDKCLDEKKTSIPVEKIEEIVLCYTSELSTEEIETLEQKCEAKKINLSLFGIGSISFDLLQKYPNIAKDYLGIEVDTGQIIELDKFLELYEKNKLATTLKTTFKFREKEMDEVITSIENDELTVISGPPGVGKSRIAVEVYKKFIEKNDSYKAFCIFNKGADLFEDIQSYFSDSGDYLILVDDANRISGFQYILQLLHDKRSDQNFKILVTVRDYALHNILDACRPFGSFPEISLKAFTDNEIKKLVQDEYQINHHMYLDRIADISQGNPRIAIMAAKLAKDSNTLESIHDVTDIYDKYFYSIKSDLDALNNDTVLKVVGIISFFRTVDKMNNDIFKEIVDIFKISAGDFWKSAKILHDLEILDMFENDVVKISDQVLSTYLFYVVFIKEKLLDFKFLIKNLFPQYKQRLVDAINPVLNTLDIEKTKKIMLASVDPVWIQLETENEKIFNIFVSVFWFLKPTDTLVYIKDCIEKTPLEKMDIQTIDFKPADDSSLPEIFSTLSYFHLLGGDESKMSLDLFFEYVTKQPQRSSYLLHVLIERYGFRPESYLCDYYIQKTVVEKLAEKADFGKNELFSMVLIVLAENYLKTQFHHTGPLKGHSVTFSRFNLLETEGLLKIRKTIWDTLFYLYKKKKFANHVIKLINKYSGFGWNLSIKNIVEKDSEIILPFIKKEFKPSNLSQCIVAQKYFKLLGESQNTILNELKKKFNTHTYDLYYLLASRLERKELEMEAEEYRQYRKLKIRENVNQYTKDDYILFLKELQKISDEPVNHEKYQTQVGINFILEELSERNESLYISVFTEYLKQGDFLKINPSFAVSILISICDSETTYQIISNNNCSTQNNWLFHYYQNLPKEKIIKKHLEALSKLYLKAESNELNYSLEYLLHYEAVEKGYFVKIIHILYKKYKIDPSFAFILSEL